MKRLLNRFILPLVAFSTVATSCSNFLDEQNEDGMYDADLVWSSAALAEGVLLKGYQLMGNEYASANRDMDDFVTSDMAINGNLITNSTVSIATGFWTSSNGHLSFYTTAYDAILQINDFLANCEKVDFAPLSGESRKKMYQQKLQGEAHALRAWWYFNLLRAHAGESGGQLLGIPYTNDVVVGDDAKLPRESFAKCVENIVADCDAAIDMLPSYWVDGASDDADYNHVMGASNTNRINAMVARQIKTRVLLMAASKSYEASGYEWAAAAEAAAEMIDIHKATVTGGDAYGLEAAELEFYTMGAAAKVKECKSVFWSTSNVTNTTREASMYPPSLYGSAKINPSQNLVDCFPMADGYPIGNSASAHTYDATTTPFANRDPRLAMFIYCDGATLRARAGGSTTLNITTGVTSDAPGKMTTSSRTGYYLRKLLDETTDCTPKLSVNGTKYRVFARYTETLLNFAEAANEVAASPSEKVNGYSALEIINAIRTRAGITSTAYADGLDKAGMRELIRNERRIELCFENFRFYDLQRWADLDGMNEDVMGVTKSSSGAYSYAKVEDRVFEDYMIYGPIPYTETLKYDLAQNKGWD